MSRLPAFLLFLFMGLCCSPVHAQVHVSSSRPLFLSVYGTASGSEREFGFPHGLGSAGGFILEHSRFLSFDFRGEMLRAHSPVHTYLAEAGPRASVQFRRLQPFIEFMGGLGHSGYVNDRRRLTSAGGWAWTADAGLDLRVTHHLAWRVGEYSYNEIYAATGAKPVLLNTGVLYRF